MEHPNFLPIGSIQRAWAYYARRLPEVAFQHAAGGQWHVDCPMCQKAHLRIDGLTGFWSCTHCRRSGDIYQFEEVMTGLDPIQAILAVDGWFHRRLLGIPDVEATPEPVLA